MNKTCKTIQEVIDSIEKGADADKVIPYDLSNFSKECIAELMMIYIKYGFDDRRKEICKKKLNEVGYAGWR